MPEQSESKKYFEEFDRKKMMEMSRKVLLAGLGAASLAREEAEHFLKMLVERGEMAEKDARDMMREILDRREQMRSERKAESHIPSAATRADIEELSAKISELNKKIEELRKAQKS